MNNPIYGCILAGCVFIGFMGMFILRYVRLKNGRYQLIEGRVTRVDYAIEKRRSLSQKGYSAEIEYFVNGEKYSMHVGKRDIHHYVSPLRSYRLGEKVELVCDSQNPCVVFRKWSPFLYLGMIISASVLIGFIITMIIR